MTLDEILANLQAAVVSSSNEGDSESSRQRERNYRAYYMEPLDSDTEDTNLSQFVSSDVFDVVEDTKAALSSAFAPHRNVIRFKQTNTDDADQVELGNQYVRSVFWGKNKGEAFIRDAAHDGCLAKNAIAKVYWKEQSEIAEISVEGLPLDVVEEMLLEEGVEPSDSLDKQITEVETPDGIEMVESAFGYVLAEKDTSFQCVELIAPENFFADQSQVDADKFLTAQDRVEVSFDELKEMGVDDAQIDSLTASTNDIRDTEDSARHVNDSTYEFYNNETITEGQTGAWLYNAHFLAELDDGGVKAWHIKYTGSVIIGDDDAIDSFEDMDIDEAINGGYISEMKQLPYHTWSPYPLSHRWSGMAVADPVIVIWEMRTKMQRSIIDYMARTNNPRMQGSAENVVNFNDMIENPIGGFIDLDDPAIPVSPVQQPQMSPMVFQTLEMITQERDERVPITRTAAGRNQEAVSNQNAASMIENMASRGEKRMAMVARGFAAFLKDIMLDMYNNGIDYDDKPVTLEVNGEYVEVIPSQLPKRDDMVVAVALTTSEATSEAQRLLALHQTMVADPMISTFYTEKNRYQMMNEVAELMDRKDFSRFLTDPSDPEFMQQQQQAQQQQMQADQQSMQMQQQFQVSLIQAQGEMAMQIEGMKAQQRDSEAKMNGMIKQVELMLKEREVDIDEATASVDAEDRMVDVETKELENKAIKMGLLELTGG